MDAARIGTNCPPGVGPLTNTGWWSSATSVNVSTNTDVMNQLCRVCGEPAAGFHFGAFTCEGCKSFFGRTYNNLGSISECKNGGVCVINKKNRTACKACRLRKCLIVGMSKSGSRYGRRSNWFKIHCLLQEQSHQVQTRLKDSKSLYESFSSLDVANNNSNSNNVENNVTSGSNTLPNSVQDRLSKKDETQDLAALRSMEVPHGQELLRPPDISRPHNLLRPETRFPMWRAPFFHPALTQMQLLNASPFFPFQQRFIVPYMNQVNVTQPPTFGSSSESASSRSTPSPKEKQTPPDAPDNQVITDQSIAFLRSLGPEQDEPIDLSTKPTDQLFQPKQLLNQQSELSEVPTPAAPPLDLTRKT